MNLEQITLGQIAVGVGFLVALFGGLAKILKPLTDFNKRIDKIEEHQDNDNKRLDKLENDTKQILLSVNALLQHSIDNNHSDELKKRKAEMDEYLIKR